MNLSSSYESEQTRTTLDSQVELDSQGAMQTISHAFRHFHQGVDEFGRSLDVGGDASLGSIFDELESVASHFTADDDLHSPSDSPLAERASQ